MREALFNALCHSQYNYGVPIQISVYADKIYIANSGALMEDPGYSYSAIAKKLSIGRTTVSTRIKALKDKGLIERIGSDKYGYWRIMD